MNHDPKKKTRVLIVEDERLAAEDLSIRLEQHNCEIVGIAGTGPDAIRISEEKNPEIILMDIQLRGDMDGIETARRIHEQQPIPVIFATAYGDDAHISMALEKADPYGFLHKPVDDQAAYTMITIALSRFANDQAILRVNDLLQIKGAILGKLRSSDSLDDILYRFNEAMGKVKIFDTYWVALWFTGDQLSTGKSESLSDEVFSTYCAEITKTQLGFDNPIMPDSIMNSIMGGDNFYTPMVVEDQVVGLFGYSWAFEGDDYTQEELVISDISQFFSQRINNLLLKQERVRTQGRIAESEAQITAIVEQSSTGIYLVDSSSKFVYVNDRFCEILDRPRSEIINHEFMDFLGDSRELVIRYYKARQAGENPPSEYEINIIQPDGSVRDVILSANSFVDSSGAVKSTGHILDVTDQKLATIELKKLSQAVAQSPVMTIITDIEGNIEYVNTRFTEIMGYTAEEVLGQNPRMYSSGKHDKAFYKELWDTINTGATWSGEIINSKRNGELCWERLTISPMRDTNNKITHFISMKEDISQQKREQEKSERDQKLRDVLFAITSAAINAEDVTILYENIYHYISDIISSSNFFLALLNSDDNTLYFPFDRDYYGTGMPDSIPCDPETSLTARTITTGKTIHVGQEEIRKLIGVGQVILEGDVPSVWLGIPLKVKDDVIGALVLQEYNGLSHYENEDVRLLDLAAGQVALTIDRARKDNSLRTLATELANANSMKELLLDVITHDLRNPAGVISSVSEMLMAEDDENDIYDLLINSSESLMKVIENATVLSKLSLGEKISKTEADLVQMLTEIGSEFTSQLATAGMRLHLDFPESLIHTFNPILSEIPKNYISNAIKYAANGGEIWMKLGYEDDQLVFRVDDKGSTISPENRDAVFQRSVQLSKGEKKGRGLGLAIVKRIAEAHEAEVGIEESPMGGNSFYLKFSSVS